jgi:hypothetical protein
MKIIFRLKSVEFFDIEDYISLARNIKNTWDNMKDLDAMFIPKDVEVYVVDDDSKVEVVFDGKQELEKIDAEPVRHGHWIFNPKDAIEMMFTVPKCSECGAESPNGGNYCPNCGAKMDGGKNETNAER